MKQEEIEKAGWEYANKSIDETTEIPKDIERIRSSAVVDFMEGAEFMAKEQVKVTPKHLKYGLAMADVCISEETADLILRIHKRLQELGGNFSLKDASEIRAKWDEDCRVTNEILAQKQSTK